MIAEIIVLVIVLVYIWFLYWVTDLAQQMLEQNIQLKNELIEHNLKVALLSEEDRETLQAIYDKMEEL